MLGGDWRKDGKSAARAGCGAAQGTGSKATAAAEQHTPQLWCCSAVPDWCVQCWCESQLHADTKPGSGMSNASSSTNFTVWPRSAFIAW
jgi:hypothetical protein